MASLAEVPVKSVYFDGENVLVKQGDGSWVVNKDHEFDFVSNFFAAPGAELKIGALQFKWTAVGSYGVLQPRLLESDGDERAAPAADLTVVMRGLVEAATLTQSVGEFGRGLTRVARQSSKMWRCHTR